MRAETQTGFVTGRLISRQPDGVRLPTRSWPTPLVLAFVMLILAGPRALAQSGATELDEGTAVGGALRSSLRLATMQHLLRVALEDKTRVELAGPFFGDYRRSLRLPQQWSDGDSGLTNYVGHPVQGAASGFIWLDYTRGAPRRFAVERAYFQSRLRAAAFAAGYSAQFEVGPFSEASLGNVGMRPETAGWVDHVMTPVGGLALMLGEEALDRFVIARVERSAQSAPLSVVLRMLLNPSRSIANVASLQAPWHRPDRPLAVRDDRRGGR